MQIKKILIVIFVFILFIFLAIAFAGIYKFNYLASQPDYDVDGNKKTP